MSGRCPTLKWEHVSKRSTLGVTAKTLRDLRIGEVSKLDMTIEGGHVTSYRARVSISFKYQNE